MRANRQAELEEARDAVERARPIIEGARDLLFDSLGAPHPVLSDGQAYCIASLLERLLARGPLPPSPRRVDDEGVVASLSVPLHPVSYLRAVAHAMLEGEGFVVSLAAEIGFDDAKLELLGIAVVLPRPVYGPDAALIDPLPPKLHG